MGSQTFPSNCYKLVTLTTSPHQISTLWIPATAKPTHLATATHATIVASALVIRPLASVTSRAARSEQNNLDQPRSSAISYKKIFRFPGTPTIYMDAFYILHRLFDLLNKILKRIKKKKIKKS